MANQPPPHIIAAAGFSMGILTLDWSKFDPAAQVRVLALKATLRAVLAMTPMMACAVFKVFRVRPMYKDKKSESADKVKVT